MASNREFINFLCDQLRGAGCVRFRPMMGEYCLYVDEKVVGLVCDNQFFLKMTPSNREILKDNPLGYPYPGAKAAYVIADIDDRDFLALVTRNAANDLQVKAKRHPVK